MAPALIVKEVGIQQKVSTSTVRRWLQQGLPHYKIGNTIRINQDDLVKFLSHFKKRPALSEKLIINSLTSPSENNIDSVKGGAGRWYRSYCAKNGEKTRKVFSRIYGRELTPEEAQKIKKNLLNLGRVLLEINRGSDEVRDLHED